MNKKLIDTIKSCTTLMVLHNQRKADWHAKELKFELKEVLDSILSEEDKKKVSASYNMICHHLDFMAELVKGFCDLGDRIEVAAKEFLEIENDKTS